MSSVRKVLIGSLLVPWVSLAGCSVWTTRYSGAYASSDHVSIYLYKDGRLSVEHCGVCRVVAAEYRIDLRPMKRRYTDDEIWMGRLDQTESHKVRGTISFNETYTVVTIAVESLQEGRYRPFAGNGTYPMNPGE